MDYKRPLVSIIIPVFNSEKTITRCLDSVNKQTYKNLEIIVVDDGSTDNSKKIVLSYANKYKNIRYYYQENMGPAAARNKGIACASGEFLCFVDSDDSVTCEAIERLVGNQQQYDSDLVIGNRSRIADGVFEASNCVLEEYMTALDAARYTLQGKIKAVCLGKLYRKEFIIRNKLSFPDDRYGEDIYFLFKLYGCNPAVSAIPYDIYVVFNTEHSICNSYNYKFIYQFDTLDMVKRVLLELGGWADCEEDYYRYYSHILHFLAGYGCRFHNRKFIKEMKKRNRLPGKYIHVTKGQGWKVLADSFLFKASLPLYCEIKMVINKRKKRKRSKGTVPGL